MEPNLVTTGHIKIAVCHKCEPISMGAIRWELFR